MIEIDIPARRNQMGLSLIDWASSEQMSYQVHSSSWHFLSGLPAADVNLAMIHDNDEKALVDIKNAIDRMTIPALLMLADKGKCLSENLGENWTHVGVMPFMFLDLEAGQQQSDKRVRRAKADDIEEVISLLSQSFELERNVVAVIADVLKNPEAISEIWILEEGGQAVSTVTTIRVEDAVTVWCMGTPPEFTRKGYGRALLGACLAQYQSDGVKIGLLGATEAGKPLYDSAGWQMLEEWDVYLDIPK